MCAANIQSHCFRSLSHKWSSSIIKFLQDALQLLSLGGEVLLSALQAGKRRIDSFGDILLDLAQIIRERLHGRWIVQCREYVSQ